MMNWLGIAIVLGALGGLLGGLRLYQRWGSPHPEILRKILHVGMGLVACSFPWLFDSSWPILVLGCLSLAGMVAMRTVKAAASSSVGTVVSGVDRASLGEIYFPLAIAVLWHLFLFETGPFRVRALLYCIPLLLLTVADAAAALVGVNYGSNRYVWPTALKSTEGSFAFFLCAFLCVHIPLLLFSDTGRTETLLIGLLLALVAMLFEAIAWAGLDNLILPLVGYLLLKLYPGPERRQAAWSCGASQSPPGCCSLFSHAAGRRICRGAPCSARPWSGTSVGRSAAGPGWSRPLIVFFGHTLLSPRTLPANSQRVHNIHAVVAVCGISLFWLFVYQLRGTARVRTRVSLSVHAGFRGSARHDRRGTAGL